jgi:poly(ADP-ribose) glycohydrolase ARH3
MAGLVERRSAHSVAWGYTDDGAMIIAVAQSLLSARTIEPVNLLQHFARSYEPARGFGRGMKIAISGFTSGVRWDRCAFAAWPEGSRGNGGAVRIAPVAATSWRSTEDFQHAVQLWLATRVTHAHADALAFARLQACALAIVLHTPHVLDDLAVIETALFSGMGPAPAATAARLAVVLALVRRGAGASAIDPAWTANMAHEQPSPAAILDLADGLYALEPIPPVVGSP